MSNLLVGRAESKWKRERTNSDMRRRSIRFEEARRERRRRRWWTLRSGRGWKEGSGRDQSPPLPYAASEHVAWKGCVVMKRDEFRETFRNGNGAEMERELMIWSGSVCFACWGVSDDKEDNRWCGWI